MKHFFTRTFFENTLIALKKPVFFSTSIAFICGLYLALFISPPDYQQGETVRIMYIHVPAAWLSLSCYATLSICAFLGLWMKLPLAFLYLRALAPIGCTFALITLITGALWGKPMWGTFWVWDGRLTSVFILFITYLAILMLLQSFQNTEKSERMTAFFALLGAINLPIIKGSVVWWNTLHQPPSVTKFGMPSIHESMLTPLIIMTLAFMGLAFLLFMTRCETLLLKAKLKTLSISNKERQS